MQRRMMIGGALGLLVAGAAGVAGWRWWSRGPALPSPRAPVPLADYDAALPVLTPPDGPLRVFHLGHSLVGRDMPAFLAQMGGHDHASQLGWGTPLRAHWEDRVEIAGFDTENAHAHFRPAREALASGSFDAVVLTEMVELRDALRWHAGAAYLARWVLAAQAGNPDARIYLYETWHRLDDPAGWLERVGADLPALWLGELAQGAMAWGAPPVHIIPGGQALAAAARAAEGGTVPGVARRQDFLAKNADGTQDPIHVNDLGAYVIALTHYAVLYHRSPEGLPTRLARADGSSFSVPPETAAALQALVWQVVRTTPRTGVSS